MNYFVPSDVHCLNQERQGFDMISQNEDEAISAAVRDTKPCPMCGAQIAALSEKCARCGEILAVRHVPKNWPKRLFTLLSAVGIGAVLVALLLPATRRGREPSRRAQCKNNLKQIALALYNYQEQNHCLPPACTADAD